VTFQSAGLYSFYVEHFENVGSTGVTVLENNTSIPKPNLYATKPLAVPEPASLLLLGVSLAAVGVTRLRKCDMLAFRDRHDSQSP